MRRLPAGTKRENRILPTTKTHSVLFVIIGLSALGLFFVLVNHSKPNKIFRSNILKQEIIQKAETYFDPPIKDYDLLKESLMKLMNLPAILLKLMIL